jgi:hypothetical protein
MEDPQLKCRASCKKTLGGYRVSKVSSICCIWYFVDSVRDFFKEARLPALSNPNLNDWLRTCVNNSQTKGYHGQRPQVPSYGAVAKDTFDILLKSLEARCIDSNSMGKVSVVHT